MRFQWLLFLWIGTLSSCAWSDFEADPNRPYTTPWLIGSHSVPPTRPIQARIHDEAFDGELTLPVLHKDTEDSLPEHGSFRLGATTNNKDNHHRYLKTGTTIVGLVGTNFCILGADTRATANRLVADPRAFKLHLLSPECVAAGAGTSADLEHLTREARFAGKLEGLHHDHPTTTVHWLLQYLQTRLYEQQGNCQANLIVAGMDNVTGKGLLRALHPHGSMDVVDYTALGSGGYAAMAVLEDEYRPDLSLEEAVDVCVRAVTAGIRHDLGSGNQVDVCVLQAGRAANLTRAVVCEEVLAPHVVELPTDGGVNGFTSVPSFVVQNKRILRESRETMVARKVEEWKDVLK